MILNQMLHEPIKKCTSGVLGWFVFWDWLLANGNHSCKLFAKSDPSSIQIFQYILPLTEDTTTALHHRQQKCFHSHLHFLAQYYYGHHGQILLGLKIHWHIKGCRLNIFTKSQFCQVEIWLCTYSWRIWQWFIIVEIYFDLILSIFTSNYF